MPSARRGPVTVKFLPVLLALLAASTAARQTPAAPTGPRPAGRQPADPRMAGPGTALKDPGAFGSALWRYLTWPNAAENRGVPDYDRPLGAPGPAVWETWKSSADVFLPDGSRPVPWNTPIERAAQNPVWARAAAALGPVNSPYLHYLAEPAMIDGRQIVDAAGEPVRYEVKMNRDAFSYIVNHPRGYELFNREGQQAARGDASFAFNFPAPSIEVKAAWRVLGPGVDGTRYWTSYGIVTGPGGQPAIMRIGLTGLHVISKIVPPWLWFTFEQVDNATATFRASEGRAAGAVGPNPTVHAAAAAVNAAAQPSVAGTPWQYYALQGWQRDMVNDAGQPALLANSQIETYFQTTASCMSCHALAAVGPAATPHLDFWAAPGAGRVGRVDLDAVARQQYPGAVFKSTDFVWSLRAAQSKAAK